MKDNNPISRDQETFLEDFAAELTQVAYLAALRHGVGGSWVDLELGLWHALADTVRKWGNSRRDRPCPKEQHS
jgi:hypothetical protein